MRPTHRSDRNDHSLNRPHAGDARPTQRPTRIRRNATDYERRDAFQLTSQMRLTRGRLVADAAADYEPTLNGKILGALGA